MDPLLPLTGYAGSWRGTSTLQDPHRGIAEESPSTAMLTPPADGSISLEYTWSYQDKPQAGWLRINWDGAALTANWTDTWHTSNQPMAFVGVPANGPAISLLGSYAAPPGPDWGWRINLTPEGERWRLEMWNIWPAEQGGKEDLAVEAVYERA